MSLISPGSRPARLALVSIERRTLAKRSRNSSKPGAVSSIILQLQKEIPNIAIT
jgi:hypothetical protein